MAALALIGAAAPAMETPSPRELTDAEALAVSLVEGMVEAAALIRDETYTFHTREYSNGSMAPMQAIAVKYRRPEHDVYMKWVGDHHRGQEAIFRAGWNQDRLRVSPGAFIPTLNIDPSGRLALREAVQLFKACQ